MAVTPGQMIGIPATGGGDWHRETLVAERLNQIGGVYAKAPASGLEGLIHNVLQQVEAKVVALVVETSEGKMVVRHQQPEAVPGDLLQSVMMDGDIQPRVRQFAEGREEFIRFERSASGPASWHEALFIRVPPLDFSRRSTPAFICVVDRFIYRGPDEALTIESARYLVTAVTSLFRRLEAHILSLEHVDPGIESKPNEARENATVDAPGIVVDRGLGIDDQSVVEEWAPWMQLAHIACFHHELVTRKPEDEPACRRLLEDGWTQGLKLRRAIGVDQDVHCGKTALKTVLDWTQFIDADREWIARKRGDPGFASDLRTLLSQLVKAARLELNVGAQLNERTLGCHLLAQLAGWPKARKNYWLSSAPSDDELQCALSSIARLVHNVIGGVPMDRETIQAYIWVLSEYAHNALGLPAQLDLRAHLGIAEREEPVLHGLRRFYRGHFFHAMEVCLLGHFLLDLFIGGEPLWKRAVTGIPSCNTRRDVLKLWYLTALLHDVGYAVDIAKGAADLFRMFGKGDILDDFATGFKKSIDEISEKLAKTSFQGYTESDRPGEDHGVISARHLEILLERIAGEDGKFDRKDYAPAVQAIASHNSHKHKIVFETDPLAFLLVLCDALQEWRRPALSFAAVGSEVGAWLLAPEAHHRRPSQPFRTAHLTGLHLGAHGRFHRVEHGEALNIELVYDAGILKNWGVFGLWLSSSYNLQRLDPTGLGFDIDLGITTPYRSISSMHSLRDCMRETHMSFLDRWFPNVPTGTGDFTNGYLTYRQCASEETLTLHLRALAEAKPLTKNIAAFRDAMKRWRGRDVEWDFEGDYGNDGLG